MSLKQSLLSTSRFKKKLIVLFTDFFCIFLATLFAMSISDVDFFSLNSAQILRYLWVPLLCVTAFWAFGVYSSVIRYIEFSLVIIIAKALSIAFIVNFILKALFNFYLSFTNSLELKPLISTEGWLVGLVTASFLIIISRLVANYYLSERESEKRVVIYGAGSAGIQLASALRVSKEMQPIAFLDRNPALHGTYLVGIKVLHPKKLQRLALKGRVDEVLIAMPSASKSTLRTLLKEIENFL